MASYPAARAVHKTLTGTTVDTVTLSSSADFVEVLNYSLTDLLWVRVDGVTPVAAADDTHRIPPNRGKVIAVPANRASVEVLVLGNGNAYTVEAN